MSSLCHNATHPSTTHFPNCYQQPTTTTAPSAASRQDMNHVQQPNRNTTGYSFPPSSTFQIYGNNNGTTTTPRYNNDEDYFPEYPKQTVLNYTFDTPSCHYQVTDIIGNGTYGVVAIATDHVSNRKTSNHSKNAAPFNDESHEEENQVQVALKKNIRVFPNKTHHTTSNNGDQYVAFNNSGKLHQLRMLRELKILHHMRDCPYIVSLKDVHVPSRIEDLEDIEMVTSLMEADLRDIFDSKQVLSAKHIKWFLYQILLSVFYMQQAKILHRDLKPENVLVNSQCDVSICDFGLARGFYNSNKPIENDEDQTMTKLSSNYVVSRWYRAPELLTNSPKIYNRTLDMWSVGCIMYELLSGQGEVLFKGTSSIDQIKKIVKQLGTPSVEDFFGSDSARDFVFNKLPYCKRRSFSKRLPFGTCPMGIDLMKRMLQFNMYNRITVEDALLHPYFREFYDESDLLAYTQVPFDTAWEDFMYTTNDLKVEAYNTLKEIKKHKMRSSQQLHTTTSATFLQQESYGSQVSDDAMMLGSSTDQCYNTSIMSTSFDFEENQSYESSSCILNSRSVQLPHYASNEDMSESVGLAWDYPTMTDDTTNPVQSVFYEFEEEDHVSANPLDCKVSIPATEMQEGTDLAKRYKSSHSVDDLIDSYKHCSFSPVNVSYQTSKV